MNAEETIRLHREWKDRFRRSMGTGEALDTACIAADDCCQFGKWLRSEGKALYGKSQHYARCVECHAEFHREAAKVADAVNHRQLIEADRMLAYGTAYAKTSEALAMSVIAMFRG